MKKTKRRKLRKPFKILLTVFGVFLVIGIIGSIFGGGETPQDDRTAKNDPKQEEKQKGKVDKININNNEGTLKYTGHELTTDFEGRHAIIIYYDYTNKKEDSSYAQATFWPQLFQNGIECDFAFFSGENEVLSNASKHIMKDTTLNIGYMYLLQDLENPVTIKVTDQSEENILDNISQQQEINLQ